MSFNPNPELILKNQYGEESTNYVYPGSTYGQPLIAPTVTLTAAQILALGSTSITVAPAVTGKVIRVVAIKMAYTYVAAFVPGGSHNLQFVYSTSGNPLIGAFSEVGLLDQTANKEAWFFPTQSGGVGIRGGGIQINSNDGSISGGTGSTLACTVYYMTLS